VTSRLPRNPLVLRDKVKRRIVQRYFVRWHMTLILAGVLLSGVLASRLLLLSGISSMPFRYLLAVTCSYAIFFLLVRIWLSYVMRTASGNRVALDLDVGLPDLPGGTAGPWGGAPSFHGRGGTFGGGGGGASFEDVSAGGDAPAPAAGEVSGLAAPNPSASASSGGGGGIDLDLDDGFVVLLVFALLLAVIFGGAVYLVYMAPAILSEAAFQALLAAALARASRRGVSVGWEEGVLKSTCLPYIMVLIMAGVFGWVAHTHCPAAVKLLEVFRGCVFAH
jgi:hypothetical protein